MKWPCLVATLWWNQSIVHGKLGQGIFGRVGSRDSNTSIMTEYYKKSKLRLILLDYDVSIEQTKWACMHACMHVNGIAPWPCLMDDDGNNNVDGNNDLGYIDADQENTGGCHALSSIDRDASATHQESTKHCLYYLGSRSIHIGSMAWQCGRIGTKVVGVGWVGFSPLASVNGERSISQAFSLTCVVRSTAALSNFHDPSGWTWLRKLIWVGRTKSLLYLNTTQKEHWVCISLSRPSLSASDTLCITCSFIEHKKASFTWHYRLADPDFGESQAKDCQTNMESTILSKLPVEILVGKKNVLLVWAKDVGF